jgi:hypothetical protein
MSVAVCQALSPHLRGHNGSEVANPITDTLLGGSPNRIILTWRPDPWADECFRPGQVQQWPRDALLVAADHGVGARALLHGVPVIPTRTRVHRADKHKVFTTDLRRFLFLLCLSWQARPICDTIRRPISSSGVKIRANTRVNYDIIWRIAALQCSVAFQQPLGCNAPKLRNPNDSIPSLLKSTGEAIRKSALHLKGEA